MAGLVGFSSFQGVCGRSLLALKGDARFSLSSALFRVFSRSYQEGKWSMVSSPESVDVGGGGVQSGSAILLVEDTEENQMVVQAFLRVTGCRVETVENGVQAVEKFVNGQFDLVLMDLQLPEMDGFAATQAIRQWELANRGGRRTPIVALTAHSSAADLQRSVEAGCDLCLSKPVRKQHLLDAVRQWIAF